MKGCPLMKNRFQTYTLLSIIALLGACATSSPDVVERSSAQRLSSLQDATVISVNKVVIDGSQSGMGAAAGAVVGGVLAAGNKDDRLNAAAGVLGAVAGGVIGNAAERMFTKEDAVEIIVQLTNGERKSIIQGKGEATFKPGDKVILISTGGKTRVQPAGAAAEPAK
jgi:outer membrane lipoprotein SlyB